MTTQDDRVQAVARALVAAAHDCFDGPDPNTADCTCPDPIYVSAKSKNKVTEISGSPEALAAAALTTRNPIDLDAFAELIAQTYASHELPFESTAWRAVARTAVEYLGGSTDE